MLKQTWCEGPCRSDGRGTFFVRKWKGHPVEKGFLGASMGLGMQRSYFNPGIVLASIENSVTFLTRNGFFKYTVELVCPRWDPQSGFYVFFNRLFQELWCWSGCYRKLLEVRHALLAGAASLTTPGSSWKHTHCRLWGTDCAASAPELDAKVVGNGWFTCQCSGFRFLLQFPLSLQLFLHFLAKTERFEAVSEWPRSAPVFSLSLNCLTLLWRSNSSKVEIYPKCNLSLDRASEKRACDGAVQIVPSKKAWQVPSQLSLLLSTFPPVRHTELLGGLCSNILKHGGQFLSAAAISSVSLPWMVIHVDSSMTGEMKCAFFFFLCLNFYRKVLQANLEQKSQRGLNLGALHDSLSLSIYSLLSLRSSSLVCTTSLIQFTPLISKTFSFFQHICSDLTSNWTTTAVYPVILMCFFFTTSCINYCHCLIPNSSRCGLTCICHNLCTFRWSSFSSICLYL